MLKPHNECGCTTHNTRSLYVSDCGHPPDKGIGREVFRVGQSDYGWRKRVRRRRGVEYVLFLEGSGPDPEIIIRTLAAFGQLQAVLDRVLA